MTALATNLIQFPKTRRTRKQTDDQTGIMFGKGLSDKTMSELQERFSNPVTENDWRDLCIFAVLSQTGIRAKELVNLKFSDLVTIPDTGKKGFKYIRKGGKIGIAILSVGTLTLLQEYHKQFGIESDYVFVTMPNNRFAGARKNITTRTLQRIINKWSVETCSGSLSHPHALRHTVGQKMLDKAGSIACQKILGHSSPVVSSKFYTRPYFDGSEILSDWSKKQVGV